MLGGVPVCVWSRRLDDGWEARIEARTLVGALESECLRSERKWAKADDHAIRSMAQTRATSKALGMPIGFVMQLASLEVTPAEEIRPPRSLQRASAIVGDTIEKLETDRAKVLNKAEERAYVDEEGER